MNVEAVLILFANVVVANTEMVELEQQDSAVDLIEFTVSLLTLVVPVVVGLLAAWFGHWLATNAQSEKSKITVRSYLDALATEIRYCGELASTYVEQGISAPLYRLPSDAYRAAVPILLREGIIKGAEWGDIQKFYLQVDQVNRGLNNVDAHLREQIKPAAQGGISWEQEIDRLTAKCREMKKEGGGTEPGVFYVGARDAAQKVFQRCNKRETI